MKRFFLFFVFCWMALGQSQDTFQTNGGAGGGGGSGTVTSVTIAGTNNHVTASGTCTGTITIDCTLSISSTLVLPGTINGLHITTTTGTLGISLAKVLSVSNSLTLAGTDNVVLTFPATNATIARTDDAQTFTNTQTFGAIIASTINGSAPGTVICIDSSGSSTAQSCPGLPAPSTLTNLTGWYVPQTTTTGALTIAIGSLSPATAYLNGSAVSSANKLIAGASYSYYYVSPYIYLNGSAVVSGATALGTSSISSGACATVVQASATGVTSASVISWTPNASLSATTGYSPSTSGGLSIAAYPTSGYVNFDVCNWSANPITPGAVTLNWQVVLQGS